MKLRKGVLTPFNMVVTALAVVFIASVVMALFHS